MAEVLLDEVEIARRVGEIADAMASDVDDESVLVCLLAGGLWFAADLTRALARRGRHPLFDCMWLTSYGDARETSGRVIERAGLQRPVAGRRVFLLDEVIDSGLSLGAARAACLRAGAIEVRTAVFARKAWPHPRDLVPDYVGWEAPDRFLVGFGMDAASRHRGEPEISALD